MATPRTPHRILVTGSHGYIGSVLTGRLQATGYEVVGLDTGWFRKCQLGAVSPPDRWLAIDVRDVTSNDLEGIDAIIHLAALSNDPLGNLDPQLTYDINHLATVHLARMARQAGVSRFIFSSSCSTYGQAGDDFLDESAALHPVTAYGHSKVRAERDLIPLADDSFVPVFLRNATAYGFSPRLRLDLVVNDFVSAAVSGRPILIKSDGTPWRPLVHVEDICLAMERALVAPAEAVRASAFNIGHTSQNFRVREVADIVQRELPSTRVDYAADGGPDARCYRVNCDLAPERIPGFTPHWTLDRGIADLARQFREQGMSAQSIQDETFLRLAELRRQLDGGELASDLRPTRSEHVSTTH